MTGKVALDDGSAAPRGTVMLRNAAGSYRGAIQPDGTYTITGVPNGDYDVAVVGVLDREPEQGMNYDEATGDYVKPEGGTPKSLIDAKYSNPEKSGLKLSVPGNCDLKLDRAGAAGAPAAEAKPSGEPASS